MLRRGLPLVDPVSCSLVTDDSPARADLRRPKVLGASGPSCDPRSSAKAAKPLRPNNHIVERRASPSSTRMSSESKNLLKTTDAYLFGHLLAKARLLSVSRSLLLSPGGCPGTGRRVPSRIDSAVSRCPRTGALQMAEVGWSPVGISIVWAAPRICWHSHKAASH